MFGTDPTSSRCKSRRNFSDLQFPNKKQFSNTWKGLSNRFSSIQEENMQNARSEGRTTWNWCRRHLKISLWFSFHCERAYLQHQHKLQKNCCNDVCYFLFLSFLSCLLELLYIFEFSAKIPKAFFIFWQETFVIMWLFPSYRLVNLLKISWDFEMEIYYSVRLEASCEYRFEQNVKRRLWWWTVCERSWVLKSHNSSFSFWTAINFAHVISSGYYHLRSMLCDVTTRRPRP